MSDIDQRMKNAEESVEKKAEDPGADHDEDHGRDDEEEEMDPKHKLIQIIVSTALLILAAVITKLNPLPSSQS